jgi:hypothetical protein
MGDALRDPRKPTNKALTASPGTDLAVRSPTLPAIPGPDLPELLEDLADYEIEAYDDLAAWLNKAANIESWRDKNFAREGEMAIGAAESALEPNSERPEIDRISRRTRATWDDISAETLLLIGAFAPGSKELGPYADQLAHRIAAREPTRLGLSWACRHLIEAWGPTYGRSVPPIKHVIGAFNEAERKNYRAVHSRQSLPQLIADAKRLLIDGPKLFAEKCLREKAENEARNKQYEENRAKRQRETEEEERRQNEEEHRKARAKWLEQYRWNRDARSRPTRLAYRASEAEFLKAYREERDRIATMNMADADKKQAQRDAERERNDARWRARKLKTVADRFDFVNEWNWIRQIDDCSQDERDLLFHELLSLYCDILTRADLEFVMDGSHG